MLALKGFWRCWERRCYGSFGDPFTTRVHSFLLLFTILRACHLRHSAAKWSLFSNMPWITLQNQCFWSQMVLGPSWPHIWLLRMIFWWYLGDILTKYDQKFNFCKMSMSGNSKNVYFSETKSPQDASRHKRAFQNQKMKIYCGGKFLKRSPGKLIS